MPNEAVYLSALALRSKAHWGYSKEFLKSCENELTYDPVQLDDSDSQVGQCAWQVPASVRDPNCHIVDGLPGPKDILSLRDGSLSR